MSEYGYVVLFAEAVDSQPPRYEDESTWVLGCGDENAPVGIGGVAGTFTAVPDGVPHPEGATQISDNVYTANAD